MDYQFTTARPRLALLGCGAVIEQRYAASLLHHKWMPTALVDPSAERRQIVAQVLGIKPVEAARATEILGSFDAVIAALPHSLHEPLCVELLRVGKHVLVEKPMAPTSSGCAAINRAATEGKAKLAVSLPRRQSKAGQWLKAALDAGALGAPSRFVIREGSDYSWPLASDFAWRRESAGGGVLIDTGAHIMDQVIWWFGEPDEIEYFDDADGGVEAEALVKLRWKSGLEGEVELTRTHAMPGTVVLTTENAELRLATVGNDVRVMEGAVKYVSPRAGKPPYRAVTSQDFFTQQLAEFEAYIRGEPAAIASGVEGARSVSLIERCYASRRRLDLPWIAYMSPEVLA